MKQFSKALVVASAMAAMSTSQVVMAESPLTANIGVASNYIWRGVTQTNDGAAVSGGVDYAHASGLYAGIWVSNEAWTTPVGYEEDIYIGFGGEAGGFGYDVSYIMYTYPVGTSKDDFSEVILSGSYGPATLTYAMTVDKEAGGSATDDTYMSIGAEFPVGKMTMGVLYGSYDFDGGSASDYTHIQLSLSKDDFTIAYDVVDPETDDPTDVDDAPRLSVSWSKSFDL